MLPSILTSALLSLLPLSLASPIPYPSPSSAPTPHLPLDLPIPARSTLSSITCIPSPPFSTLWTILSDPHECLKTCGRLSTSSIPSVKAELGERSASAVIRRRPAPLGSDGLSIGRGAVGGEYDCICASADRIAREVRGRLAGDESGESGESWCNENSWVVYTPLRSALGEMEGHGEKDAAGIVFQLD